jgi:hypothetical protein
MKKEAIFRLFLMGLTTIFLLLTPNNYVSAADIFELNYTLTEGGYRLELNPATPYKGVKIEVSSDVSTRYEVVQRIITPLENRDNPSIVIRDNFVVRGLRGTNRFGNFRVPTEDTTVNSDEIFYVSDTAGDADTFTLAYGITQIQDITPGNYFGRISFILSPIDSTRSIVTKFLDVYVNISQGGETKPIIEIIPVSGLNAIVLDTKKEEEMVFDAEVKINGRFNNLFSISQFLNRPLESNEGNQLDYSAVNFETSGITKGMGMPLMPLSNQRQAIYTSTPSAEAPESFVITYSLGDISGQKAGRYTSNIQYYLEQTDKPAAFLKSLNLEVNIERIFDIMITPQDEEGTIEFKNVKPKEPPKKNEVAVSVRTNIGKKYQVSQNVYSELMNKEGNTIPAKYFNLQTESLDTKGTLMLTQKAEVKKGDSVLFISDDKGSADNFKVIYELAYPMDIKAGDYSTRITYSLSEI